MRKVSNIVNYCIGIHTQRFSLKTVSVSVNDNDCRRAKKLVKLKEENLRLCFYIITPSKYVTVMLFKC
jgi:hypothetical protein